jgi:hypothetical protein
VLSELAVESFHFTSWFVSNILIYFVNKNGHVLFLAMLFGGKKRTCGFGYDLSLCPVCLNLFDRKSQNIGGIS